MAAHLLAPALVVSRRVVTTFSLRRIDYEKHTDRTQSG